MSIERRFTELRAEGDRVIGGTCLRYGDTATLPWGRERFEPRAFGDVSGIDAILNLQHDRTRPLARTGGGGLTLADDAGALVMRCALPATRDADDALELVRTGVLRGLSVEFHADAERMDGQGAGRVRVIERARLTAIGLVDKPAFPDSTVAAMRAKYEAETRQDDPPVTATMTVRGKIPFGTELACGCHKGECNKVEIEDMEIPDTLIAVHGEYAKPLASLKRGTLTVEKRAGDGLHVGIDQATLQATEAGRNLMDEAKVAPMYVRPVYRQEASDFEEKDGVARYRRMVLRALTIGATDAAGGLDELVVGDQGGENDDGNRAAPAPKRRRISFL